MNHLKKNTAFFILAMGSVVFLLRTLRGLEMNDFNGVRNPQDLSGDDARYLPRWKVRNRMKFALKGDGVGIEELL